MPSAFLGHHQSFCLLHVLSGATQGGKFILCAHSNFVSFCGCHPLFLRLHWGTSVVIPLLSPKLLLTVFCLCVLHLNLCIDLSSLVFGVITVIWFFAADTCRLRSGGSLLPMLIQAPSSCRHFVALSLVDALPPWFLFGRILRRYSLISSQWMPCYRDFISYIGSLVLIFFLCMFS